MKKLYIVLFIAIFFITGCEKDKNNPASDGTQNNSIPIFSGYSATDNTGLPVFLGDSTDWTSIDHWVTIEKELFEDYETLVHTHQLFPNLYVYPGYPNPTTNTFFIPFVKDSMAWFKLRIVNQKFETLVAEDSIYSNNVGLALNEFNQNSEKMLRAYYMCIRNDSCLFKGHGDIKINELY